MREEESAVRDEIRLWVYRSLPVLSGEIKREIQAAGDRFVQSWQSHGQPLKAEFRILNDHYLVFFVDQTWARNSGCSIDASVQWIRQMETRFNLGLFDRMNIGFEKNGRIVFYNYGDLKDLYNKGEINDNTATVNHLVDNGSDFRTGWIVPFSESPFYASVK